MTGFILLIIHLLFFRDRPRHRLVDRHGDPGRTAATCLREIGRLSFYLLVLFFLLLFVTGEFGAWGNWG